MLIIALPIWFFTHSIIVGALVGAFASGAFFLGREHTQTEYKIMDKLKINRAEFDKLGFFYAWNFKHWTLDGILDVVFPIVANMIMFGIIYALDVFL